MNDIFENGKFKKLLLRVLKDNNELVLMNKLGDCDIELKNVGNAFYTRKIRGRWNCEAIDVKIYTQDSKMSIFTDKDKFTIKEFSDKLLPEERVIGEIDILPLLEETISVTFPKTSSQELETLTKDINDAINKNEPSLVLDRLHTFSTKYLRELCEKYGIKIQNDDGKKYPLHSLAGSLKNYYTNSGMLSKFSVTAISSFISLFDSYNEIRNNKSYAHDNDILPNTESVFVLQTVSAMLNFLDKIEIKKKNMDDDLPF
jgi:hypothetical protein